MNDTFLHRNGARVGFNIAPAPWVELGAAAAYYPILGNGGADDLDWKPLAKRIFVENNVSPNISKLVWQVQLVGRVHAFQATLGGSWKGGFGVIAGGLLAGTQDDLIALQRDDESALATQDQVHAGPVVGVFWDARHQALTLRVRFEFDAYVETINSSELNLKKNGFLGAEAIWWFG
ncbi:MAG: hypothetical protein Q8P18_22425 [Pseudomonadota bacterium]|nr:hypothetical protein [Pseudomonadota bacterium]